MTGLAERRKRVLRLRSIEHRIAAVRATEADEALANLRSVAGRITTLRGQLGVRPVPTSGQALKAMCEMAGRLDAARTGLAQPITDAEAEVARKRALRMLANQKEAGATKLKERAVIAEHTARDLRADANRPFRRRPTSGDAW